MTLERLPDGSVRLGRMDEWHLRTLRSIPALADPGDDDATLRRLYPAPFAAGDARESQQEDWAEIVQPELEQLFQSSLSRVAADLRNSLRESEMPPDIDDEDDAGEASGSDKKGSLKKPEPIRPPKEAPRKRPRPPRAAAVRPPAVESSPVPPVRWQLIVPAAHVEDWYRAMNQARLMLSEKHEAHRTDNAHIAKMFVSGKMESLIQYELLTGLCGWWVEALMQ